MEWKQSYRLHKPDTFRMEKMSKFNTCKNEKIFIKCAQNGRCTSSMCEQSFSKVWIKGNENFWSYRLHKLGTPKLFDSRGTKVGKVETLAPERYTAEFGMVAKVILWCIWNHCIADLIDLHNVCVVSFLRKPNKNMWKYHFSKCHIFLSKKIGTEKYRVYIIKRHRRRPQTQWWSYKNTSYWFLKRLD